MSHPYYPQNVDLGNYSANTTPLPILLGSFGGIITIVLAASLALAKRVRPGIQLSDQLALCWFALSGCPKANGQAGSEAKSANTKLIGGFLHCFFEGYYVLNHADLPGSQSLFAQLWKEYALSDSRYLTSDPFMLCIESITVVGPRVSDTGMKRV